MASRPSLRLVKALPTARRAFSTTPASHWAQPRPSLAGLPFDISPEVQAAQAEGRAIVALESTLITHGLPPPHSAQLPKDCEDILRAQGVTPATIAILDGRIKVGLTSAQLDELAEKGFAAKKDGGAKLWKVGRRELGAAVVKRMDGGTTVSGTMAVAHLAGIKIFSTGGIGGVHRGAETSFDISSDLISLSDTPVTVVCAGSKSILDIGLTLEYLEAHAVPVAAYGTLDWPAFYTPTSGFKAPMQLDTARQVAETIIMTDRLALPNSLLLGVPIPEEYHDAGHALQEAVEQAVRESVENGVNKTGKAVTPWLLKRVSELTEGSSIVSNKALIKNNVKVGGEIALEYARLLKEAAPAFSSFHPALPSTPTASSITESAAALPPASLLVVGSLAIDITMTPKSASPLSTTAPGCVSLTLGGVAGNVAGAAQSLLGGHEVQLVAPVADDLLGTVARQGLKTRGMRDDGLVELRKEGERTATCGILLDERGDLVGGVADMSIAAVMEGDQVVERIRQARPKLVAFDGNLSETTMSAMIKHCSAENIPTFFEPTSNAQSLKLLRAIQCANATHDPSPPSHPYVTYSTPNIHELSTLYSHLRTIEEPTSKLFAHDLWFDFINVDASTLERKLPSWVISEGIVVMAVQLLPIFGTLFVKSGARGVVVVQRISGADTVKRWKAEAGSRGTVVAASSQGPEEAVVIRHYEANELNGGEMISATGAGDNLAGVMMASMLRGLRTSVPEELDLVVGLGQRAACNTLRNTEAVGEHSELRKLLPSA